MSLEFTISLCYLLIVHLVHQSSLRAMSDAAETAPLSPTETDNDNHGQQDGPAHDVVGDPAARSDDITNTAPGVVQAPQFFDRDGMHSIHSSLTRLSDAQRNTKDAERKPSQPFRTMTGQSDGAVHEKSILGADEWTLTDVEIGDGPFDFERFLRQLVVK